MSNELFTSALIFYSFISMAVSFRLAYLDGRAHPVERLGLTVCMLAGVFWPLTLLACVFLWCLSALFIWALRK